MLCVESLSIIREGTPLFEPISFVIAPGEICGLQAPSGAGKSVLLRWILGALPDGLNAQGRVSLDGVVLNDLATESRQVGLMLQQPRLFPHLSVRANVAFALPSTDQAGQREQSIDAMLNRAGLSGYGDRDPATLSGGEQSRVALLRSLLAEPKALLLDEPFSSLDKQLREDFRSWVYAEIREQKIPALIVSHDAEDLDSCDGLIDFKPKFMSGRK